MSTTNLSIRIDEGLKKDAEELFSELGLSLSAAVNIFFRQSVRTQSVPFELKRYSKETEKAMMEANNIIAGNQKTKSYSSARELFDELDKENAEDDI